MGRVFPPPEGWFPFIFVVVVFVLFLVGDCGGSVDFVCKVTYFLLLLKPLLYSDFEEEFIR